MNKTDKELLVGALSLLVRANVLTLDEIEVAFSYGTDTVWDLLKTKYAELDKERV